MTLITIFSIASAVFVATPAKEVKAAANPTLEQGDQYGLVWGAQSRLKQLDLYKGEHDGLFGPLTEQAVKDFQSTHGLNVDGVIGDNTWKALRNETFSEKEIKKLAKIIHGEARGEPFKGKVAVASVVLNRVHHEDFPNNIKGVIFESGAFTAVADKQYYLKPNGEAYKAAYSAIQGWDPSEGATYYFNPVTATSDWIWTRDQIKKIGKHIFAE